MWVIALTKPRYKAPLLQFVCQKEATDMSTASPISFEVSTRKPMVQWRFRIWGLGFRV